MFGFGLRLTGGAISKVVAQSSKKETELPVAKPIDALEQFNSEHGNVISSFENFKAFDNNWNASKVPNNGDQQRKKLVNVLWSTFWRDVLKAAVLKAMWGGFVIFSVAFFVFRLLAYIKFKSTDQDHTPAEREESYYLSAFFFVSMVVLSVSLQQMTFVSSSLGQKVKHTYSVRSTFCSFNCRYLRIVTHTCRYERVGIVYLPVSIQCLQVGIQ